MSDTATAMIDAWVAHHGRPIPWAKAVEILTVVNGLSADERDRLLALDDTTPPVAPTPEAAAPAQPVVETQPMVEVDDGILGPPPMAPSTPEERAMLDAIAAETDLSKFPGIVTRLVDGKIYDNDGFPLSRINRALLRRMWELHGRR